MIKVILGVIILFLAGKEIAHAGREIGTYYSPGILLAVLLFVVFGAWMIGSGLSISKFRIKSAQSVTALIMSIVTFAFSAFFSVLSYQPKTDVIASNGISVDISSCMDGNRRIIADKSERRKYCSCIIEKLSSSNSVLAKNQKTLELGEIDKVISEAKSKGYYDQLDMESCSESIEFTWTNNLVQGMKTEWKRQLEGTGFAETNDLDLYCDCLLSEYRNYPVSKINSEEFVNSDEAIAIDERCSKESLK